MSLQTWREVLVSAQVDGTPLNTSISATSIIPAAAKFTLPTNYFAIGRMLKVTATGRISNIVTSPGTLTLDVRLSGVIAWTGGAVSLNAVAKTNVGWTLEAWLTCRAIGNGTAANLIGQGRFTSESVVGAAAGTTVSASLPAATPPVGTGFDSTAALVVDLFAAFSVNNVANSIQLHQYMLESLL